MKDLALALREQFGRETEITPLIAEDRMGRRIHGVDLTKELSATQAELMISLLDQRGISRNINLHTWRNMT